MYSWAETDLCGTEIVLEGKGREGLMNGRGEKEGRREGGREGERERERIRESKCELT